jgi:hypothetical protein
LIQSDNEFANAAVEELVYLLGARQLFSLALRPQSQGIVERGHKEIRNGFSVLVSAFARACPRTWPNYTRWMEHRARHRPLLADGTSAYSVAHGFYWSSPLQSSLVCLDKIPVDLVTQPWLNEIVAESKRLGTALKDHFALEAKKTQQRMREESNRPIFKVGNLVLLQKPFYEKGTGLILPQCDGPWEVASTPNEHTATLREPLTEQAYLNGQFVSTGRLVHFNFPKAHLLDDAEEVAEAAKKVELKIDMTVAVEIEIQARSRVLVAKIKRIFEVGDQLAVDLYTVPLGQRFGPWERRPWELLETKQISRSEVICQVELVNRALSGESLERMAALGINIAQPLADMSLPAYR